MYIRETINDVEAFCQLSDTEQVLIALREDFNRKHCHNLEKSTLHTRHFLVKQI